MALIPASEYPHQFTQECFNIYGALAATVTRYTLIVPDRDIIVDAGWIRFEVEADDNVNLHLAKVDDGDLISASNVDITGELNVGVLAAATKHNLVILSSPGLNELTAGQALIVELAATNAQFADLTIGLRYRERYQ